MSWAYWAPKSTTRTVSFSGADWTGEAEDTDGLPAAVQGVSVPESTGRSERLRFTRLPPHRPVTARGGESLHRETVRAAGIRQLRAAPYGGPRVDLSGPPVRVAGTGPPWDRAPVRRSGSRGQRTRPRPGGPGVWRPVPVPAAAPQSAARSGVRPGTPRMPVLRTVTASEWSGRRRPVPRPESFRAEFASNRLHSTALVHDDAVRRGADRPPPIRSRTVGENGSHLTLREAHPAQARVPLPTDATALLPRRRHPSTRRSPDAARADRQRAPFPRGALCPSRPTVRQLPCSGRR